MSQLSAPKIEIKSLKTCQGREGTAYSCTVYVDGKKVANARQDGNGGMLWIDWSISNEPGYNNPVKERLQIYCNAQPDRVHSAGAHTFSTKIDIETLIEDAVDALIQERQLRKWCKAKVVFRLVSTPEGEYLSYKGEYNARTRAQLELSYGKDLVEIVNERFV